MTAGPELSRREARETVARLLVGRMSLEEKQSIIEEWWPLDSEDDEWSLLPDDLRIAMEHHDEPIFDPDAKECEALLEIAVLDRLVGVRNEWLQNQLANFGIYPAAIVGAPESMHQCPCCDFASLKERGEYFICLVCFWEDDGNNDEAKYSSPNHKTLGEGKATFEAIGACSEKSVALVLPDGTMRYSIPKH